MKKSSCFKLMLSMVFIVITSLAAQAQSYHSTPTAITNLADESKYITAILPSLSESDQTAYLRQAEKQRIIINILSGLKVGKSVEKAVEQSLPTNNSNQITVASSNIPLLDGERNASDFLRPEILKLVTY